MEQDVVEDQVKTRQSHDKYSDYYRNFKLNVYPSEFLVRAFLGSYERHKLDRSDIKGKKVLDLGFGDGRNVSLLANLGLEVYGTEVTQEICTLIEQRMVDVGINFQAKLGRNTDIPYDDNYFDFIVASSACYYMDPGDTYDDNLKEIARVLKPGGIFIHSLPMPSTFIMDNAEDIGDGHMKITKDPYGVRVGAILKKFDSEEEVIQRLENRFKDIKIGSCRDDFWGDKVHLWLVVCEKK